MKNESTAHGILKRKAIEWLRTGGYNVFVEYRVEVEGHVFYVDVVGFKGTKSIAIECGRTSFEKMELLKSLFSEVKHLSYTSYIRPKNKKLRESRISTNKAVSRIFQRGKSQVPLMVRNHLGVKDGDKLLWIIYGDKWMIERA